ncbi:hypothetical protein F2Q69_00022603 [Brassica cretica]|uniref:Uncharacterized protein n=1 Tax=Brassica cretica TaxID=69181 RepID=A0A8S9QDD4_BRACR|nr:hypothetical protein F2Q69_00022603 [Brassica cretica]
MPKIDVAHLSVLSTQPKPSETTSTHSDDAAEPIEVDKAPMGRTLRKRKGNVAKHLKREANEKETEKKLRRNCKRPRGADWRAFLSTVREVCNMQTNQLCLTLIDPHVYYTGSRAASGLQKRPSDPHDTSGSQQRLRVLKQFHSSVQSQDPAIESPGP